MSVNEIETIDETENKTIDETENETIDEIENKIMDEIKYEFLNMASQNHTGYNISLDIACKWLNVECDGMFRKNIKRRILNNSQYNFNEAENENDENSEYIIKKDSRKEIPYFSNDGFKMFCLIMNKSSKAQLVRKYFIKIEKEYVSMLKMSIAEYQEYKDEVNKNIEAYKKENGDFVQRIKRQSKLIDEQNVKLNKNNIRIQKLNEDTRFHHDYKNTFKQIEEDHDTDPSIAIRLGIRAYETTYGKQVVVQLYCDKYINEAIVKELSKKTKQRSKKQTDRNATDDENTDNTEVDAEIDTEEIKNNIIDKYGLPNYETDINADFSEINCPWVKEYISDLERNSNCGETELYFSFKKSAAKTQLESTNKKKWDILYFFNESHFKIFEESIANLKLGIKIKTLKGKFISNIYKASYTEILNLQQETLGKISLRAIEKRPIEN